MQLATKIGLAISIGFYLDGDSHERPAFVADVGAFATRPHIIVVCQVNVKYKLPLHWHELSVALQPCM